MAQRDFIISGFGLSALKPIIYRKRQGEGLEVGHSGDFSPSDQGLRDPDQKYPGQRSEEVRSLSIQDDDKPEVSFFGMPVFCDLMLESPAGDNLYMDTILFEVNQAKNIVTTSVQGRPGTVKEYIAMGDYEVMLRGAIVNSGSQSYPYDRVNELIRLLELPEALTAVSEYLQLFNVYNLVVMDYAMPQQEGFQNVQLFEINCLSDTPEELIEDDA